MTAISKITARLISAVNINNTPATARLLNELEARLPPEQVIAILEAVLGEDEAPPSPLVACA